MSGVDDDPQPLEELFARVDHAYRSAAWAVNQSIFSLAAPTVENGWPTWRQGLETGRPVRVREVSGSRPGPAASSADISWSGPNGTFNLRVAAVIRRGDEVLLCTVDGLSYWFLPGGRVRLGEASKAALARELAEELGHQMAIGKLAFVVENIVDGNTLEHEIGLYYHVAWPASLAPDDLRRGGELGHRFCWLAVPTLGTVRFEPAGLAHFLRDRRDALEHVLLSRPEP